MPSLRYTVTARRSGEVVELVVEFANGQSLRRTVTWAKVDTPDKLARWLLDQQPDPAGVDDTLTRAFVATYHIAAAIDGGGPVIDSVQAAGRPEDLAWTTLSTSQLGTITLADALAQVDAATNFAQLKAIVRALVQVVIPLRDVVDRLLAIRRSLGLR